LLEELQRVPRGHVRSMSAPALRTLALGFLFVSAVQATSAVAAPGDITIERPALGSTIRIETSARYAGAVSSLVFRGKQYVDTLDHGRELQSAESFDGLGECFNPTEAGTRADHTGPTSSSKVVEANSGSDWLETKTDMAFWRLPGEDYGHPCSPATTISRATNKDIREGYLLSKRITIGEGKEPNVIADHVDFTVPEAHTSAVFEAATLYTPTDFSKPYILNLTNGNIEPDTKPGEQEFPVIVATSDGKNAVGLFSPLLPQPGVPGLGYGYRGFPSTQKINCVFRAGAIPAGKVFHYDCYFVVGTLDEVKASILSLHGRLAH
jgi:hypothetical protein